jgi:ribonuclease HIII
LATINAHHQTPADVAQANGAAQVEQRFAQPILQVLQMFSGNPQAFYELGACIVGHGETFVGV